MLTLSIGEMCIFLIILTVPGGIVGYLVANYRQRSACGGKTPAELKEELAGYKDDVTRHFRTTAGLLQQMTDQYRAVYEHMADGAQRFCDPDDTGPLLENLRAGLLVARPAEPPEREYGVTLEERNDSERETGSGIIGPDESTENPLPDDRDITGEGTKPDDDATRDESVTESVPPETSPGARS